MRRILFLPALSLALSMVGCGMPQPQSPDSAKGFRTQSGQAEGRPHVRFFQEPRPADFAPYLFGHLGDLLRCLGEVGATACTVTGSGNIAVDASGRVVAFTVNVTQPASGSPTGTVTLSQTIQPPFNLQSSSITSVSCVGSSTTITGNLVQGGTFRLNATDYAVGPDYVEVFTPYYAAGGPVVSGGITVDTGAAAFPGIRVIECLDALCPPNGPTPGHGRPL